MYRAMLPEPKPEVRPLDGANYVDLARRMSIPADDAIRHFIESWAQHPDAGLLART